MRVGLAFVLVAVLAACSPSSTTSGSPSATPTVNIARWPSTMPAAPPDFSCRIPVYSPNGLSDSFISLPDGVATPAGIGGRYYDAAVGRWLTVPERAVAPDGLRYAYVEGWASGPAAAPRLHIVDARTDQDLRVVTMADALPYAVVNFNADGVFLMVSYEGTAPGVWRVDPGSGVIIKVSDRDYVPPGPTWISVVDPKDPNPVLSAVSGLPQPNRIDYRDASGRTTTWLSRPGWALAWVAYAGRQQALVLAYRGTADADAQYWLVTGPNQATLLASEPLRTTSTYYDLYAGFFRLAFSDSHGVWLGGEQGLYLVTPSGAISRVYGFAAYPANGCL